MNIVQRIILGVACLFIIADTAGHWYHLSLTHYTKPLTLPIIILLVFAQTCFWQKYNLVILIGLFCSLIAGVFLEMGNHFLYGVSFFLLSHIFYITGFSLDASWRKKDFLVTIPFIIYGSIIFSLYLPNLKDNTLPLLAYLIAISTMGWRGVVRALVRRDASGWIAALGGLTFICSDSLLGWDLYRHSLNPAAMMFTYHTAELLIALSVPLRRPLDRPTHTECSA